MNQSTIVKNKKITVMGLGLHGGGLAVAKWLLKSGATQVLVTDLKSEALLADAVADLKQYAKEFGFSDRLQWRLGEHVLDDFIHADIVVQNPAVPRNAKELQAARNAGVIIHNEASLFFLHCTKKIIGITGSKGKSTTTALLGAMVHEVYPAVPVAGNIRTTAMVSVLDEVNENQSISFVILELSSWQLEVLAEFELSPWISILTNILPEHLNRYDSFDHYASAKAYIHQFQHHDTDYIIYNADDPVVSAQCSSRTENCFGFSLQTKQSTGIWLENDYLHSTINSTEPQKMLHLNSIQLPGEHNIYNVMAATAVALVLDIPIQLITKAVEHFKGLSSRMELVDVIGEVRWYNDTTATAPVAVVAALRTWKSEHITLIAGGSDKGSPLDELAECIISNTAHCILLPGDGTDALIHILQKRGYNQYITVQTMEEAVARAQGLTPQGGMVLLSPGFASFASFKHEFDRGEAFERAVKELQS